MSTGYSLRFYALWITLQTLVFAFRDSRPIMASSQFTPYVSEFEYASRFHPSKNPDCPIGWSGDPDNREEEINRRNFESSRYRRSPEEGSPVGQEPSIEVRAILVRCPKTEEETDDVLINRNIFNITAGRSQDILDFHGFDSDEPTHHSEIRDCRRKLVITMKFNNIGRTKTQEEFVVIDHVLDPVTMHKARLLNPFVVKVRQEPVLQLYGLKFQGVVNAEAREEVINNKQSNYTGCDDTSENPTCGQMFFEEGPIPYSQGFCCSCDPEVNIERQASTLNETVSSSNPRFFSKSRNTPIKPFKSSRSVNPNFLDDLSDPREIRELSPLKELERSIFENSKNANFQQSYHPVENNSTRVESSSKDEIDLMKLKDSKTMNEKTRISSFPNFNEITNQNRMEAYESPRFISSSLISNSSGTINEKPMNIMDGERDNEMGNKGVLAERKDEERLSKRKSTINIIDELAKLEEDYKNFRISSVMRDERRNNRTSDNRRLNIERNSDNERYSDRRLNIDDVEKFRPIESLERKLFPKNNDDSGNLISTLILKGKVPVDEMIYDRSSTLGIDVKLVFGPRDKSINRVNSTAALSNICASEILQPVTMMTRTFSKAHTPAILWQKIASDRVYPSSTKNYAYSKMNTKKRNDDRYHSTETTTSLNEKFDRGAAVLPSDMSNNAKLLPDNNLQSNNNRSSLEDTHDTTVFENSITTVPKSNVEVTSTSEPTITTDQRNANDFTTSSDEPFSRAEKFTDPSSSFSRGNHTKSDAIVLSGSLINQLGNWLTYGKRKKHGTRGDGKNSRENDDEKIEFGSKDEVDGVTLLLNVAGKKHDRYEDRSSISIADRRPVEIYLETSYDRESSNGTDDKTILPKSREFKSSPRDALSYSRPQQFDITLRKKFKRRNFPRSHRSTVEDDRLFAKDNDRQRNIDKRIEDEFQEISDVLKDAGDGTKIVREKPKSDETFEKDDSVMKKFALIFDKIPKDVTKESDSKGSFEVQTLMSQNIVVDPEIYRKEKDRLNSDRFKPRIINDDSKIRHDSHEGLTLEKDTATATKIVNVIPSTRSTTEETHFHVTDPEITSEVSKHNEESIEPVTKISHTTGHQIITERFKPVNEYNGVPENHEKSTGYTNVPAKTPDLEEKVSTTRYFEPTTTVRNESSGEPISEIPLTTEHPTIVDKLNTVKEFQDIPGTDKESPKHLLSDSRKLTNISRESEKELLTNTSFPNVPSPVFTIENLKKQLRKEAEHYSLFSQSQSTAAGSSSKNVEKHWKYANEVRDVNTELTPAEKVEDSITDKETLPPDEETNYTTTSLPRITNFQSPVTTATVIELAVSNSTVFPRFAFRNFEKNSPKKNRAISAKRTNEIFLVLDEPSPSPSASFRRFKNNKGRENSIHRRRHRRNDRNKKRLTKNKRHLKRNIVTTTVGRSFVKSKAENEDEENTWYDTTIAKGLSVPHDGIENTTMKIFSSTISTSPDTEQNRKRRHHPEIPVISKNGVQQASSSGKRWLSISESGRHSRTGDLRVEDISKSSEPTREKSRDRVRSNVNIEMAKFRLPVNSRQKESIFQESISSNDEADAKRIRENGNPEIITGRSTRNLQTLSSRKFPSFYPKSSDIIAMSEKEHSVNDATHRSEKNNKRDDTIDINENARKAVIFYDYDDSEDRSIADDANDDGKRSFDNSVPKKIKDGIEPSEGWKEKMELLKLKKHADVIKEYLNWHQDVAPPESHGLPGYTTKISITKERPEKTTIFVNTMISNESNLNTLPSTESTYLTITEVLSTAIEQETNVGTLKNSNEQNWTTEDMTIFSTLESSPIATARSRSKNLDPLKAMGKVEMPTGCLKSRNKNNMTEENVRYDEEESTGRILPPCDSRIKFTNNVENNVSPRVISDHRDHMSDLENDLIVISVLEKSRMGNKNIRGRDENKDSRAKIYKIHEAVKSEPNPRHRRHRFKKKKSNRRSDKRQKRVPGRRLMSVQALDENNENYDEDLRFEENEENNDVESSNDENTNNLDVDEDSEMLKRKWNDVIDKIISKNFSESWGIENTTKLSLRDISGDNRAVLKKLHFYNADKYIKKIAKKIVHNSNIHDSKDEKNAAIDKIKRSHQRATSGRRQHGKRHILVGRKLNQYSAKSMTQLRYKMADSHQNSDDSSHPQLHSIQKNQVSNFNSNTAQSGHDFAISLSGRIHVEGGTNGQPISISFDTSPDIQKTNETVPLTSNKTSLFANDTKNNAGIPLSTNSLSSFFNIAPVPKELEHKNSNVSLHQSVRAIIDDKVRTLRANRRKKFSDLTEKGSRIRKSRAVDPATLERYSKHRDDRSYDLESSKKSKDADNSEDYPESSIEDEDDSTSDENSDSPVVSLDRGSLESRRRYSNVDEHRSLDSPEVRIIKVIPLEGEKSSASLSILDSSHENHRDTKVSRMTASQLPKMTNGNVPERIENPGKIKPAEPWLENETDGQQLFDSTGENFFSKSSGSDSTKENESKRPDGLPVYQRISTSNPMNLRVIGIVSMEQPTMNEPNNLNVNSDSNYGIVPLIHVKIQQQPVDKTDADRNFIVPLRFDNDREGCQKMEMTHRKNVPGDNSLCSQMNNAQNKVEDENITRNPVMATLNMDNDEELREPIRTCPETDKSDIQNSPKFSCDNKFDGIQAPKESPRCQGDQKTLPATCAQDSVNKLNLRKKIRMKNMLAILEFMKKIKKIMSGGDRTDFPNEDYNDAVIKLERVIILPNNRSDGIFGRHEEPEKSTHRVVMIGEGVKHVAPCDRTSLEENSRLSENKEILDMIGDPNEGSKLNEAGPLHKSLKTNQKSAESDQNQSFLFYGNKDAAAALTARSKYIPKNNRILATPKNYENITSLKMNGTNDSSSDSTASNLSNSLAVKPQDSPPDNETTEVSEPREKSESKERFVLQNAERNMDDYLRDMRNGNSADYEEANLGRTKKRVRRVFANKRKAVENYSSFFPKVKRHGLINHLPSYRTSYGYRDERDAGGHIYRGKPFSDLVGRVSDTKFGTLAAVNGISREKRRRKKKKRRRKKKRKKKKKKKKKGKGYSEAANRERDWWPYKRQLMSLIEKGHSILDSDFDQKQVERVKAKRGASRRIPSSLKQWKRHRVHRANSPDKKKKKTKKPCKKGKKRKKISKKINGKEEKIWGRHKRQIKPGGAQVRGGQDCMDRRHPTNVNPAKYLESSHCLRFSDLWYSAYELESPIMEHTVYLQLFEKHSLADGTTHWDDLTQGTMVRMGTFTRHQRDDKPTIVFTYSGARIESQKRALNLDPARQRLLVPSPVPPNKGSQYPAVGGPGEYLVVQTSSISKDGKECDKAGVGFAAFAKQEDRCGRAKGTCLKNQPLAYWRHDMEARDSGRPGCYFLSNFASVPTNPIKYNVSGTGSREYLGLEYHAAHVSAIDIEVRTDYNAIVRVGSSGRVTEVYVDSTSPEHTVLTVVISNMGLASSPYQPRITDCPTGLPVSWTKARGIMQVIPPQHDQRVTLDLYGQLLLNGFHCSVEVVNHRGELVAMRRIRVQKMDRCFCVWHCLCACIGSVSGMGCQPMSPEHYHAAGFQGPVPVITAESSTLLNTLKDIFMLSAMLVLLLLLLGLLKWFVGIFAPTVGRWGLDGLLEGCRIGKYLEPELRCRCVVTDDDGVPVHPDTGQRTVRLCSRRLEFVLNLIFFLTYPVAMCCGYFRRSLQSSRQKRCCADESKMCLINEKASCPKMICVSTYGDSRNSKLEAEDTRYVMNELKKSQESLQNPKGTKKKDGRKSDKSLSRKSSHRNKSASDVTAKRLVDDLLKKRTVFRNLTEPIGGLAVPSGTPYSLRGYFLNAENGGYRFITPCPFKQHWLIENNQKKSSTPPETYPSNIFMCSFSTARDVYESNEISLNPKGICVNVQYHDDK